MATARIAGQPRELYASSAKRAFPRGAFANNITLHSNSEGQIDSVRYSTQDIEYRSMRCGDAVPIVLDTRLPPYHPFVAADTGWLLRKVTRAHASFKMPRAICLVAEAAG